MPGGRRGGWMVAQAVHRCPTCGAVLRPGLRFCTGCGAAATLDDPGVTWSLPAAVSSDLTMVLPVTRRVNWRSLRGVAGMVLIGGAAVLLWQAVVGNDVPGFATVRDFKIMLATVVLLLVGAQLVTAAMMYGMLSVSPRNRAGAAFVHRWSGRLLLPAAALVAVYCVSDIGPRSSPTRVAAHTALGSAVFLVAATKLVILRAAPRLQVLVPVLGVATALMLVGLWATSALPALR